MKTPSSLVVSILLILGSFATVQDVSSKEPRIKQLNTAYGFVLGQQASLELIEKKFPDLSRDVKASWFAFNSSALGESVKGVEAELSSQLGDKWPKYKKAMATQMKKMTEGQQVTKNQAIAFLGEVKLRGKGKLPDSIRSTLLSANPRYSKHPSLEIAEGWKKVFPSKGHAKAKGLNIKIFYPSSWKQTEGTRPNILQKFQGANIKDGMVMLITKALPAPYNRKLTAAEKNELVSEEVTKGFIPDGAKFISHKITKIDGEIAAMFEYEMIGERVGYSIGQKTLSFIIPHNGTILLIQCATGGDASKGMEATRNRYRAAKPLFTLIASSCVFVDKWGK